MKDWRNIILKVCEDIYGIDYTSRELKKHVKLKRLYCYLCRRYTSHSLAAIGQYVGIKHSTVIYNVKVVEKGLAQAGTYEKECKIATQLLADQLDVGRGSLKFKQHYARESLLQLRARINSLFDQLLK